MTKLIIEIEITSKKDVAADCARSHSGAEFVTEYADLLREKIAEQAETYPNEPITFLFDGRALVSIKVVHDA